MWVAGWMSVHGDVWWKRGWQKEHVLFGDRVLMIRSLYPVCFRSYYELE